MKRIWILIAAGLLASGFAWGQYGYQYMSGGYWYGAKFIGQEGWMVGAGENILHTTDGGRNWEFQRNIEGVDVANPPFFTGVEFINSHLGWACSNTYNMPGVSVWKTTDGGSFWKPETLYLSWYLPSGITFADTLCGWIVEEDQLDSYGEILATTDGGRTWVRQDVDYIPWHGVYGATSSLCWTAGGNQSGMHGVIGRTTNGGQTWVKQQVANWMLSGVNFTDTLFGWACGDSGSIVHTTDGGLSWATQTSGTRQGLLAIAFLNRARGFAAGDSGTLLSTSDGGATWALVATGVSAELTTISFGDSLHGWVIGEGGTILETSDGGQTWQVTRQGTTDRIQGVSFVDDQTGWASSWEGNVWATQDGGKIWTKQESLNSFSNSGRLFGVAMANANTGWAVGDTGYYYLIKRGLILGTQNGGGSWTPQAGGSRRPLKTVFASDAQHAWACGNQMEVMGTSNGGQSWSEQFTWPETTVFGSPFCTTLYDITFCDSFHGWGLHKDGHVWRTTNKGQSWGMVGRVGNGNWYHGHFADSAWGWVAGDSGIAHTTDGGKSWVRQNTGVTFRLWDVSGVSRMRAWAVGEGGNKILVTTDGGSTWNLQTTPVTATWSSVDFVDSLHGVACGNGGIANYCYILDTRDGGSTWNPHLIGTNPNYAITLVDSLEGWAVGYEIYHTTDGGATWQWVRNAPTTMQTVCFLNQDEGWVGGNDDGYYGYIIHTTDRGVTWTDYRDQKMVFSLYYADHLRGWMGTGGGFLSQMSDTRVGQMWATTDGGQEWIPLLYPTMVVSAGQAVSSRNGVACGSLGTLFRTTDGTIWERVMPPNMKNLWGIGMGDEQTAWAVGQRGMVIANTDQGLSWRVQKADSVSDSLLTSVQAFDGLTARATGYLGRSVLTTDGGTTWNSEETGTKEWLLASSFLTPTLGWVAGENGMVLKYGRLPFGVEENKGKAVIPYITSLEQNRPNPFPERTEILYQLANKGKVRLVVYNVLGQAVRRVVDKEQEPGFYAVSWDGKDEAGRTVSSGIYFYRLESSGKSLTRKMVRVR